MDPTSSPTSMLGPHKDFESIKIIDENNIEYWEARSLMPLLDYTAWHNFEHVINKAKSACQLSGQNIPDHFNDIIKLIHAGKGATRQVKDFKLSRYACYLIAQNGDSDKEAIAIAQTYFATQSRKQEIYEKLPEDKKRLMIREEVTGHNKKLFKTARDSGVTKFGSFNDAGYLGLYGIRLSEIKERKGLGKDNLLDRAGASELAANLFRITQTDEQLKKKLDEGKIVGDEIAARTHSKVGGKVRETIKAIGGTLPENLKPEEDIKQLRKRVKEDDRKRLNEFEEGAKLT